MQPGPTRKEFFTRLFRLWGDEMSGPLPIFLSAAISVAILVTGILFAANKSWEGVISTIFVAVGALHLATYKMWAREREQVLRLEERLRPKLRCSFSMQSAGCVVWTRLFAGAAGQQVPVAEARYFRIKVETDGVPQIAACGGTLVRLTRDGVVLFDQEPIGLHVAHADESNPRTKNVMDRIPEHIDVFMITRDNRIFIATPGFQHPASIHHETLFMGPGTYLFSVIVSSPDCSSVPIGIELNWTGSVDTATALARI